MTATKTATSQATHDRVQELLPWYANGTLSSEDERSVSEHAADCETCVNDLAYLGNLGHLMAKSDPLLLSAERSFARLDRRIDAVEAAGAGELQWADIGRVVAAKLGWRTTAHTPWVRPLWASLALLAVVVGLLTVLPGANPFQTLTRPPAAAETARQVRLVFDQQASAGEIQELLNRVGVQIVSGPSNHGVYTAQLSNDAPPTAEVAGALRDDPRVVFAEPLPTGSRP